jgi:hypothetical protein
MTKAFQLATLLVLAGAVSAAAQHAARAPHVKSGTPATQPTAETRGTESAEHLKSFRGIATKLNTTPEALQTAYEQAKTANPKLTRGQFIAAQMLGQNLSAKGITTDQILAGLAGGKSIGQTLRSLGLSDQEAKAAEQTADRDVKEADKAAKAQAKPDTKTQTKPDSGH